jgi:hypothetical protein
MTQLTPVNIDQVDDAVFLKGIKKRMLDPKFVKKLMKNLSDSDISGELDEREGSPVPDGLIKELFFSRRIAFDCDPIDLVASVNGDKRDTLTTTEEFRLREIIKDIETVMAV